MPLAASFPHFLYGDDIIRTYVDGLEPDVDKHGSYVIVEPVSLNTGKWNKNVSPLSVFRILGYPFMA